MTNSEIVDTYDLNSRHLILFDGVCHLCSGWVQFVYQQDADEMFSFVSVQSAAGQDLLRWCGLPIDRFDTMVYIDQGQPYYQSTAFLEVIKRLRQPWPLLRFFQYVPVVIRNWVYDRIALNRYALFGKSDVCMVPNDDRLAVRFLRGAHE
ncbi:MAG: DCC1-like thiol-disulfide oxidoreductase family protein [Methylococcales bacterium]